MIVNLQGVPTAERIYQESTPLGLPTGNGKEKKKRNPLVGWQFFFLKIFSFFFSTHHLKSFFYRV